ncbi:unnamed protein product [Closterium sp. NIES-65]|nr:unnamed protein product [Closterium sp. NIES-65]
MPAGVSDALVNPRGSSMSSIAYNSLQPTLLLTSNSYCQQHHQQHWRQQHDKRAKAAAGVYAAALIGRHVGAGANPGASGAPAWALFPHWAAVDAEQLRRVPQDVMPEDSHCWLKYGEKRLVKSACNRSYFRCAQSTCQPLPVGDAAAAACHAGGVYCSQIPDAGVAAAAAGLVGPSPEPQSIRVGFHVTRASPAPHASPSSHVSAATQVSSASLTASHPSHSSPASAVATHAFTPPRPIKVSFSPPADLSAPADSQSLLLSVPRAKLSRADLLSSPHGDGSSPISSTGERNDSWRDVAGGGGNSGWPMSRSGSATDAGAALVPTPVAGSGDCYGRPTSGTGSATDVGAAVVASPVVGGGIGGYGWSMSRSSATNAEAHVAAGDQFDDSAPRQLQGLLEDMVPRQLLQGSQRVREAGQYRAPSDAAAAAFQTPATSVAPDKAPHAAAAAAVPFQTTESIAVEAERSAQRQLWAPLEAQATSVAPAVAVGLDGLAGMGGMGGVGGVGMSGMGEDELLVEAAAWLAEQGGLEALDWLPDLTGRNGRIDATRSAEGGSGDRDGPVDERAGATATDDASDKRPRVSNENDYNGAANNDSGSTGDAARLIWDVSGLDLVQVALEASRVTDGPRFLAPCGVRRELPLLVYLPGLDGTGVFLERHLEGLKPCFDVRCLCIPAADTSTYGQLAQLVAELIQRENDLRSASTLAQAAMGVGAVRYASDDEMPRGTSTPAPEEAEAAAAVTVVAESFGAGVALSLSASHASLVAHLVICNRHPLLAPVHVIPFLSKPIPTVVCLTFLTLLSPFARAPLFPNFLNSTHHLSSPTPSQAPFAPDIPALAQLSSLALAPLLSDWDSLGERERTLITPPFSTTVLPAATVARRVAMMAALQPSDAMLQSITASTLLIARYATATVLPSAVQCTATAVRCHAAVHDSQHPADCQWRGPADTISGGGIRAGWPHASLVRPIVIGEDRLIPSVEEAYGLATCIPSCRIKILPFSGHTALLEAGVSLQDILQESGVLLPSAAFPLDPVPPSDDEHELAFSEGDEPANSEDGSAVHAQRSSNAASRGSSGDSNSTGSALYAAEPAADSASRITSTGFHESTMGEMSIGSMGGSTASSGAGKSSGEISGGVEGAAGYSSEEGEFSMEGKDWDDADSKATASAASRSVRANNGHAERGAEGSGGGGAGSAAAAARSGAPDAANGAAIPSSTSATNALEGMLDDMPQYRLWNWVAGPLYVGTCGCVCVIWSWCAACRVVRAVWCVPCGVCRVVCAVWCVPCGVCRVVCAVCCVPCAACRVVCVCRVVCAVWCVPCAACRVLRAVWCVCAVWCVPCGVCRVCAVLPLMIRDIHMRTGVTLRGLGAPTHWQGPFADQFTKYGAVRVSPRACYQLLREGENLLLYPGGGREVGKRKNEKYKLFWRDTTDFVRIAVRCGATIVPFSTIGVEDAFDPDTTDFVCIAVRCGSTHPAFSTIGVEDAFDVLMHPEEIMSSPIGPWLKPALQATGMQSPPFPLASNAGLLPRPQRLYFLFSDPIRTDGLDPTIIRDKEECSRIYQMVRGRVEGGIEQLKEMRRADPLRETLPRIAVNLLDGWDGT